MTFSHRGAAALLALAFGLVLAGEATAAARTPPAQAATPTSRFHIRPVDDAWRASLPRDAEAATRAEMDRLPPEVVARSNAYYEGGYWLQPWGFLLGLAISAAMLGGRRSARVRDWAQRVGRYAFLRDAISGACFSVAGWVLSLPLTLYQGYLREHEYEMATQTFGPWLGDQLVALAVNTIAMALAAGVLYAAIRWAGERWWGCGVAASVAVLVLAILVGPVWIDPLFNTYRPVEAGEVKDAVLTMARANAVPVDSVYVFDASRQTTRVSANVSGILGTAAIRLVGGPGDVASLPLLAAVLSALAFLATPVVNGIIRAQEIEADRFGLNLAGEPHGEAEVDLKLTDYRKPDPGSVEELLFFDHPSTRFRVHEAMRWREAMSGSDPR